MLRLYPLVISKLKICFDELWFDGLLKGSFVNRTSEQCYGSILASVLFSFYTRQRKQITFVCYLMLVGNLFFVSIVPWGGSPTVAQILFHFTAYV